jgi:hypothetical protein
MVYRIVNHVSITHPDNTCFEIVLGIKHYLKGSLTVCFNVLAAK